jgi:CRP/FNR family cyclic AMP-dependent transcriptional regulator
MSAPYGARQLAGLGAALPTQAWAELLACGTIRRYRAGAMLLQQGSQGSYVIALTEGRVMVTRTAASGQELIVAIGDPGEILGDMTVLDQAPRTATVTALTSCTVRVMGSEQFRALIRRHDAADAVARHAFARVREAEQARFEISALPVAQRLARALIRLTGSNSPNAVGLSQDQLARLIGASRNAVVAALAALRVQGVITTSRRRLIVRDQVALRQSLTETPRHPDMPDGMSSITAVVPTAGQNIHPPADTVNEFTPSPEPQDKPKGHADDTDWPPGQQGPRRLPRPHRSRH